MPLHILGPMVVIGIAVIAILLHLLGHSAKLSFDEGRARAAWLRHFPHSTIQQVYLLPNGSVGLVQSDLGMGAVWAMGADDAARLLAGGRVVQKPTKLLIRFADMGSPQITLAVAQPDQERWIKVIGAL